ncbi:hypothetical protein Vretifemale_14816 [Volvox reticuliferus]|uniref:Uncharacterized protein n=1 Tax=Volvox reticuliferus TaxID=1737510 RepID=A0A8J4CTU8_9CHLO|nr:hypothetical protein Vretifemale_14816 [Volvox reticuliferus]
MPQPGSPVGTGPSACASSGVAPAAAANTAAPPAATLLATASDAPAADMQLLSAARRAVSLLGVTLPDSAASKAARKLLRRELMDAAKLMAAGGCGRDVDAGGVGKAGGESTRGTEGGCGRGYATGPVTSA